MKRKEFISIIVIASLMVSIFVVFDKTLAFFTSKDVEVNKFTTGDVDIEITEEFIPPDNWNGSEAYTKKVKIQNLSKSDALIRVNILPRWEDESGNPWPGDISFVDIEFVNLDVNWVKDTTSNYYYYNEIVPKEKFTKEIIESVMANIPEELGERYKGKTLIVDINAEAVQASKEAYSIVWNDLSNESIKEVLNKLCEY